MAQQYLNQPGEFQKLVMHAFGLRSELRKVFLLCEVRNFTIKEAATILSISISAATLRLNRARRMMKVRMGTRQWSGS